MTEYERLKKLIIRLVPNGRTPTREERISWAYGNANISNPNVTREMANAAFETFGFPTRWECEKHNTLGFYGSCCFTCRAGR